MFIASSDHRAHGLMGRISMYIEVFQPFISTPQLELSYLHRGRALDEALKKSLLCNLYLYVLREYLHVAGPVPHSLARKWQQAWALPIVAGSRY